MFSVEAYIKQQLNNPWYSETKWATSVNVNGNQTALVDESQVSSPKIIYAFICVINVRTGVLVTLKDGTGTTLLNFTPTIDQVLEIQIKHVYEGQRVSFTSGSATTQFAIGYQTVRDKQPK